MALQSPWWALRYSESCALLCLTRGVILFGSRRSRHGSDFDVLVIEPDVSDTECESVRLRREPRDVLAPIDER